MTNVSQELEVEAGKKGLMQRNFAGMNNVTAEDRLKLNEFREAVNVDFSKEGKATHRTGRRAVLTQALLRGLFTADGLRVFYAGANKLFSFNSNTEVATEIFTPVSIEQAPSFCEVNGDIYFTDGKVCKIIKPDLNVVPWGVGAPLIPPVLGPEPGALEAGEYLVSATCYTSTGEESGACPVQKITLAAIGGIRVNGLFAPNDPRIVGFNVYLGTIGGQVLYKAASVLLPGNSALLSTVQTQAVELRTHEMVPPPAGLKIVRYRGRIFTLIGKVLYWTEPLRYGLTNPAKNYYVLPAEGTLLTAVENGLYVACDKTYFLSGRDPDAFQLVTVLECGAPVGDAVEVTAAALGLQGEDTYALWQSHEGLVAGSSSGSVTNLTSKKIAMQRYEAATLAYREEQGRRQVLVSGRKTGEVNRLGVGDRVLAEVRRNGVVVG